MTAGLSSTEATAPELGDRVLLAIDTSLGTAVALGSAGRVIELHHDDPRGHTEAIGQLIDRLFVLADRKPAEVTGVVVGIGPGPFTGLRVGIAAAQAFALARGVPLLPVHGHESAALAYLEAGATAPRVRVLQDAKRREVFVTEYAGLDWAGIPERRAEPRLEPGAELVPDPADLWPARISAGGLVRLAARRLAASRPFEPARALYLRSPDIYPPAKPKRVST